MALTMSGINKAREINSEIMGYEADLNHSYLSEILTEMSNDPNFSKFITDTKFGQEYYEKWSNLIKMIDGDFYQASANLTHSTSRFLEYQAGLNKNTSESNSGKLPGSNEGPAARDAFYDDFVFSIK